MTKVNIKKINWEKVQGLIPAIIQDSSTGLVLMLGYMNQEALTKTMKTGFVLFYSRTKKRLWMKGETSKNTLKVLDIKLDCDTDTLLIKALPKGPICHTGDMTCFSEIPNSGSVKDLFSTIISRKQKLPKGSYTTSLFKAGLDKISLKILSTKKYSVLKIMNLIKKRQSKKADVEKVVLEIIKNVRKNKDKALFSLSKKFDGVELKTLKVSKEEISEAYKQESKEVVKALKVAKANIEKFHKTNVRKKEASITTTKGISVWREFRPIEKVGLYIPGGKASYPSTVLMLGVPAKIAGCREIILCVPPGKDGKVPSAVLVAADICGISKIFKVGGAQAIAAMAYGTESIPKVSKIFGPGNNYVTTAKMLVYGEVAIDMPAGPSEVLVFADKDANPAWVA